MKQYVYKEAPCLKLADSEPISCGIFVGLKRTEVLKNTEEKTLMELRQPLARKLAVEEVHVDGNAAHRPRELGVIQRSIWAQYWWEYDSI